LADEQQDTQLMSAPLPKENANTNPELDQLCINTIRATPDCR
jgi:hypothetical protein